MRLRMMGLVLLAATGGAPAVHAQPGDAIATMEFDTLGLAADAEPVPHRRLRGMGRCGAVGHVVVRDTADLRRLRRYPQCAGAPLPDPAGRTLAGVSVMGDCHTMFRLDAFRSESRREYRVRVRTRYGGCRAGGHADAWLELPPLPDGWTVAFMEESVEAEVGLLDPEWTSIRDPGGEPWHRIAAPARRP